MKIKVILEFDKHEKSFIIPCGTGDKSLKWLCSVATQRYALAAPNGKLRRREEYCGITENVQYQASSITLPSDDAVNPDYLIREYLSDGDTVFIELTSKQSVKKISGVPKTTLWSKLNYSYSQEHLDSIEMGNDENENEDGKLDVDEEEDVDADDIDGGSHHDYQEGDHHVKISSVGSSHQHELTISEILAKKHSKISFMRVVLKSQLINTKAVEAIVNDHLLVIKSALKLLKPGDFDVIRNTLVDNWDVLSDLFHNFSKSDDPKIPPTLLSTIAGLIEDSEIFPSELITSHSRLIEEQTIKKLSETGRSEIAELSMDSFLLSIFCIAQLKYNDTLNTNTIPRSAGEAIHRLVTEYFVPLAIKLPVVSALRMAFISDDCFLRLRDHYESLLAIFDKVSLKTRDFPTSISIEEFSDLLYHAGLKSAPNTEAELDHARITLLDVRHGNIYGHENDLDPYGRNDFTYPEEEFTFPEFIEGIARVSFEHYRMDLTGNMNNADVPEKVDIDNSLVIDYMMKGITAMTDTSTGKIKRLPGTGSGPKASRANMRK